MKIVQIAPRYPPHTGGVETHVAEVSECLAARGHDVTVLTADAGGDVSRTGRQNGITVRRFRSFAPRGAFHIAPAIVPAIRRTDPDVVHAHNYHSLPVFFAALGTGDARFVVTPHYHGGSASAFRNRLLALYRPLGEWALGRADNVIAVSEWEREQLRADFGVNAEVVPNGLDVARFANATPERRDHPYLLCVGRLKAYKGVQHAIRALPELPEYDLLIAGSGDDRTRLERVAREVGVADRVEFLGFVADERLPGLYAGAAAYLLLSSFEAYGMTVGEALASRTPCVIRTGSALDDWAANPGVVAVEDVSPATIAEAVWTARERDPDATRIVGWGTVVDKVIARYAEPGDRLA